MIIVFVSFLEPGCNSSKIFTPPLRYPPFEAKVVQNGEIWGERWCLFKMEQPAEEVSFMGRYEFIVTLPCTMNVMTGWWFQKWFFHHGKMSTLLNILQLRWNLQLERRLKYNRIFSKQVLLPTRYTCWDAPPKNHCKYTIWKVDGATPKRWLGKGIWSTFQVVYVFFSIISRHKMLISLVNRFNPEKSKPEYAQNALVPS